VPAVSKKQRRAAAIALKHPEQLRAGNASMTLMSLSELHKLASTKERGLPRKAKKR